MEGNQETLRNLKRKRDEEESILVHFRWSSPKQIHLYPGRLKYLCTISFSIPSSPSFACVFDWFQHWLEHFSSVTGRDVCIEEPPGESKATNENPPRALTCLLNKTLSTKRERPSIIQVSSIQAMKHDFSVTPCRGAWQRERWRTTSTHSFTWLHASISFFLSSFYQPFYCPYIRASSCSLVDDMCNITVTLTH